MQAKVVLRPLYGGIKDSNKGQLKSPLNLMSEKRSSRLTFTISETPVNNQTGESTELKPSN